jgi:nicotinate-nucleotide adenylyltransferase
MTSERRVGVFGGTFDPIHLGHLVAAEDAAYELSLDRVLFVPNAVPPHKRNREVSPAADRIAMVELGIADNNCFSLSLVEIERGGPSYTVDTMRELRARLGPDVRLFFVVGCDALPQLHTWHEPEALLAEFDVVIADRPSGGQPVDWAAVEARFPGIREKLPIIHVAQLDISGVDIRERVRTGRPIRYQVPPPVGRYIREHGLYR